MNSLTLCSLLILLIDISNGTRINIGCDYFRYSLQNTASLAVDLNGYILQYTIFNVVVKYKYQPGNLPIMLTNGRIIDVNLLLRERIGHSFNYFLNFFGFKNRFEMMKKQFSFYLDNGNYVYLIHSIDNINGAWWYKLYHTGPRLIKANVLNASYTDDTSQYISRIILITLNPNNSYKILARLSNQQIILANVELNKENYNFLINKIGQFCSNKLKNGYQFIISSDNCFINEDILDQIQFAVTINNSIYLLFNNSYVYVFNQNSLEEVDTHFTAEMIPFSKVFACPMYVSGSPYTPLDTLYKILKFLIILAGLLLIIVIGHWTYKCIKNEKEISNYQRFMLFSKISDRISSIASSIRRSSSKSRQKSLSIPKTKIKENKKQWKLFPTNKFTTKNATFKTKNIFKLENK